MCLLCFLWFLPLCMELRIAEIMRILPHRYPFLLVDRVIEVDPDKRIVALKNVSINEPFFNGHFPGAPVMPGVLTIEAMAHTAPSLGVDRSRLASWSPRAELATVATVGIRPIQLIYSALYCVKSTCAARKCDPAPTAARSAQSFAVAATSRLLGDLDRL